MNFPFVAARGPVIVEAGFSGPLGRADLRLILDTGATTRPIRSTLLVAVGYDPKAGVRRGAGEESGQVIASGGWMMADESSYVHKTNAPELPVAQPDIAGILFRCYTEQIPVAEAVEECRKFGAKDVGSEQVEGAYGKLRRLAEKLNKRFEVDFKQKAGGGSESRPDTAERGEQTALARRPIWELFEEITAGIPEDEWAKLPTDGSAQHDHYIYGTPKRPAS